LRPFVERLHSGDPGTETASNEESSHSDDSIQPVNTSILATSKLIYTEAISVFYECNIVNIDAMVCKTENISTLRATDLALAQQVTTESPLDFDPQTGTMSGLGDVARFAGNEFPEIFPKLESRTVYIYTTAHPTPVSALFNIATIMRLSQNFNTGHFEGVGSVLVQRDRRSLGKRQGPVCYTWLIVRVPLVAYYHEGIA
jgi:hypothetical protein